MDKLDYRHVYDLSSLIGRINVGITKMYIKQDYIKFSYETRKRMQQTEKVLREVHAVISPIGTKQNTVNALYRETIKRQYAIEVLQSLLPNGSVIEKRHLTRKIAELEHSLSIFNSVFWQVTKLS